MKFHFYLSLILATFVFALTSLSLLAFESGKVSNASQQATIQ